MSRTTIAFLGQCHTAGYPGVPPDRAFPEVFRQAIQDRRPDAGIEILLEPYYHPAELEDAVTRALAVGPRVVVIEAVGWLAIKGHEAVDLSRLPRRIRTSYDRLGHFRRVSTLIARKIPRGAETIYRLRNTTFAVAGGILRSLVPRLPRPTIAEYETAVGQAIALVVAAGSTVVVQGPGAPPADLAYKRMASDAMERYRAVEAMARRVAEAHRALYIDRWDTVAAGFYLPGSIRPTHGAHSVWGHLLADQLIAAGLV